MPFFMRYILCLLGVCLVAGTVVAQEEGVASYYHTKFHGRKMSSGHVYNETELVAAHRTLPFGTYVRVTNLNNLKSVIVCIRDRGPFRKGWIIDLSRRAAECLDFIEKGITWVRVEIVPGPEDYYHLPYLFTPIPGIKTDSIVVYPPLTVPERRLPEVKKKRRFLGLRLFD